MKREATAPVDRLYWSAAIVVGASLPHWAQLPAWVPALLVASLAWRLAGALTRWPLPSRGLRLALAFVAFSAVLVQYGTVNGLTAGSALLVVMVALKFLEARTQRDHLVLMIIAYFLVFAGLLYQSSVITGLYLVAFVWLTTIGLLQLGRGGALLPAWPAAKHAGRLLLKALPVMLILFVLFPRLPGPLWAIPGETTSATSGLADSMSPGDITALGLSDEVAFRVEFLGPAPLQQNRYWRGPVLTEFDGRTWTRGSGLRRRVEDTLEHRDGRTEYRVTLEPGHERRAFAIDMPERWDGGRHTIVMDGNYQLRPLPRESRSERMAYSVTSYTEYRALERLSAREREYFTRLPEEFNPRTQTLAAEWRAAGLTGRGLIERGLELFRGNTFFYSLTPPPLGRHTADEFLFETREGFCEHYASAFAVMMRAAGLPARVVTGYQGGWLNALGDYYIVRQSDAHAWTEVWLEDDGWVRVDPTATVAAERISLGAGSTGTGAADRRGGLPPSWTRDLALAWDAVNMHWDRWVLGYGPNLQRALLELFGFARPGLSHLLVLTVAALGVFTVVFSLVSVLGNRPRRQADPAARAFERFVAKLGHANVAPRRPGEAPSDYAERAKRTVPSAAAQIESIVRAYLRARYEPGAGPAELDRLRRAVRDFKPA